MIELEINNAQSLLPISGDRIEAALRQVMSDAGVIHGAISIAIVDDPQIQILNARHLNHDYATDVLSFVLERSQECLEGEIIVSAETALRMAASYHWTAEDELLLYVIHGALHLVGYDDLSPAALSAMREAERRHLTAFGLRPKYAPLTECQAEVTSLHVHSTISFAPPEAPAVSVGSGSEADS